MGEGVTGLWIATGRSLAVCRYVGSRACGLLQGVLLLSVGGGVTGLWIATGRSLAVCRYVVVSQPDCNDWHDMGRLTAMIDMT